MKKLFEAPERRGEKDITHEINRAFHHGLQLFLRAERAIGEVASGLHTTDRTHDALQKGNGEGVSTSSYCSVVRKR